MVLLKTTATFNLICFCNIVEDAAHNSTAAIGKIENWSTDLDLSTEIEQTVSPRVQSDPTTPAEWVHKTKHPFNPTINSIP